jgi:HAD superfamily hydrolase (TIGR01509 family)
MQGSIIAQNVKPAYSIQDGKQGESGMSNAIRGVILDMDGTLVDSNGAHAQTWVETLKRFGYDVTLDAVRPLIGQGGDKMLPRLTGCSKDSAIGQKIAAQRSALFEQQYLTSIRPFPGSRQLVGHMHDCGLKLVIASSSSREHLNHLIDIVGIGNFIDSATSAGDVGGSKPDPDVIEAALSRLELDAGEVMMIGDTPYDIEAAARVGVRTIALRCGGWNEEDLTGAVAVYADPADLLAKFDISPLTGYAGN